MNAPTAPLTADAPVLLHERDKDIATLVLNRPQARNSLSEAMLIALSSALTEIAADKSVRAVILAANGPAFCAGHDLKELTSRRSDADGGRAYFRHVMTTCSTMMQQIVNLPQPVIAAVQGPASAAGCQLVASCDLAVASTGGEICHARSRHRFVLLDPDGRLVAQRCAQTRNGNVADRRHGSGGAGGADRIGQPRRRGWR